MFFKKKKPETSKGHAAGLDYTLIRTSRRTMALQVKEGALIVRAPRRTPVSEIERWIFEKRRWILRHQEKSREKAGAKPAYREGALHPYLGQSYPLRVLRGARGGAELTWGNILVTLRGEPSSDKIKTVLKAWYRAEAETVFEDRLTELFPPFAALGHTRPPIRQRWMKGRWGSMSAKGRMSLNTQLIKKDLDLIDYVIVHELCHMEHMNHGKGFYKLMDQMLPGWKALRKQLKGSL